MSKIIKIEDETVLIGNKDGSITEVRLEDCSGFTPNIGDFVDIFKTETRIIVTKNIEKNKEVLKGGFNITVNDYTGSTTADFSEYPNTKPVNKILYCILAFFAGGLGIHKFYAGKPVAGTLYILFCWTGIPSVIALIEFIIALCKTADSNGNIFV